MNHDPLPARRDDSGRLDDACASWRCCSSASCRRCRCSCWRTCCLWRPGAGGRRSVRRRRVRLCLCRVRGAAGLYAVSRRSVRSQGVRGMVNSLSAKRRQNVGNVGHLSVQSRTFGASNTKKPQPGRACGHTTREETKHETIPVQGPAGSTCRHGHGAAGAGGVPGKTDHFVVRYSPGGGFDAYARAIAPELEKALGVEVVVENIPGAGGQKGAATIYRADPDGYTIGIWNIPGLTVPQLLGKANGLRPERRHLARQPGHRALRAGGAGGQRLSTRWRTFATWAVRSSIPIPGLRRPLRSPPISR